MGIVLMKFIGLWNGKGGAGKSTGAVTLAGALAQKHRVALVDLDPQGSVSRWTEIAQLPTTLEIFTAERLSDLKGLSGYDYAVIDTKGELSADALPYLDMALLPCAPSMFDIWAAADSIELMKAHQAHRPEFIAALYVNRLDQNTLLGRDISEALNGYGLPVLSAPLCDRIGYPTAIARGRTPTRSGDSAIRLESLRFAEAVKKLLEA
jgi:chromosome partitioning protein